MAELVRTAVDAGREVAIARGLIAIAIQLVAICAAAVPASARLTGIVDDLVAAQAPLVVIDRA